VANVLRRPLRIHIVGVEKELRFLDLFLESYYLLQHGVAMDLELVFVVRPDMLPPSLRETRGAIDLDFNRQTQGSGCFRVSVVSGVYGIPEESAPTSGEGPSLDPRFDCGSGAPDIVVGFNAGLYAYPSWRSTINYLQQSPSVIGVFTDYNEFSGVQCASILGGSACRQSLRINPFRQPRAMPVYSMNLPQFSNGFIYVCNQQELET
jgi:hypothetical protein